MNRKVVFLGVIGIVLVSLMVSIMPTVKGDLTLDTSCNVTTGIYQELLHNGSAIIINNTFTCPNGCANNGLECDSPAQPESFFAFGIVFAIAALTFAFLAIKLSEEYKPLQFMFLAFTVLYIAFGSYVVSGFATLTLNNLNTILIQSYIIGVFTVLAVVFYFMYLLTRKLFEWLMKNKKGGRPFKW